MWLGQHSIQFTSFRRQATPWTPPRLAVAPRVETCCHECAVRLHREQNRAAASRHRAKVRDLRATEAGLKPTVTEQTTRGGDVHPSVAGAGDLASGPVVRSRCYAEAAEAQPGIPPQPARQEGAPWSAQARASGGQPPSPSYEGMASRPPPQALAEVAAPGGLGTLGMWYHKISL